MIEPEVAFIDLDDLMDLEEDFIKYCVRWALDNCKDDLEFLNKMIDKSLLERLNSVVNEEFVRLEYTEGIRILEEAVKQGHKFEFPVSWGMDLASEHERYLVEHHFKKPVIMTGYPKAIKAFYMKINDDGKTVQGTDVLFPADRRDYRWQRARGELRQGDGRNRGAQHPYEGHVVVSRHAQVRHMPTRRLRTGLRASHPVRDGNAEHTRRDTVPRHS